MLDWLGNVRERGWGRGEGGREAHETGAWGVRFIHPPARPSARALTLTHLPCRSSHSFPQNIETGVDKAIDAASVWNKTILVDAALHTSKLNPCKIGYLADAAGKCTVCDFTLSMVPGCNACVDPGTCSGCGEGYNFVAADASPDKLVSGTCICDVAKLNDPKCVQCTIAGSCDQCLDGEREKRGGMERGSAWERLTPNTFPVRSESLTIFSILLCGSPLTGYFPEPESKVCTACVANCQICESATTCSLCAAVSEDGTQNEWEGSAAHLPSAMHSRTRAPHRIDLVVGGPSYLSACSSFTSIRTRTHTQGFKLSAAGQCLACPANCGECQVIGGTTTSCTQCNANFGQCSTGLCTDLTSKSNCSACGVTCNGNQVCCNQGGTYKCLGSGACN